jgi:type I restriction enzyme S subunit
MFNLNDDFARYESEGTVFGSINQQNFRNLTCIAPSKEIIIKFEKLMYSLDQTIQNNENQSRTLTNIRDRLLPKLMSGEIRVKEAERMIEEVI